MIFERILLLLYTCHGLSELNFDVEENMIFLRILLLLYTYIGLSQTSKREFHIFIYSFKF